MGGKLPGRGGGWGVAWVRVAVEAAVYEELVCVHLWWWWWWW